VLHQQRDQQSPDAAVAIEERVYRLELDMGQPGPHQGGQRIGAVDPALKRCERLRHQTRWRWHEQGVAGAGAANPVLGGPDFPRPFLSPPHATHEALVAILQ